MLIFVDFWLKIGFLQFVAKPKALELNNVKSANINLLFLIILSYEPSL